MDLVAAIVDDDWKRSCIKKTQDKLSHDLDFDIILLDFRTDQQFLIILRSLSPSRFGTRDDKC